MKDKDKVAGLIAELKALAESDFERHRISVLERDLTEPPKVEVIDDKHQKFDGVVYRQVKTGHFIANTLIHRAVFAYYNSEPVNLSVHHIDNNPSNNDILNLVALSASEHALTHGFLDKKNLPKKEFVCRQCGKKYFDYARRKNFYCPDCRTVKKICLNCGKQFSSTYRPQKFCSQKCAGSYQNRGHHFLRTCPVCNKEFKSFKSRDQICCSRACANKLRSNQTSKN